MHLSLLILATDLKPRSKKIFKHLKDHEDKLCDKLKVKKSDCLGFCKHAPAVSVGDDEKVYKCVDIKTCNEIIAKIVS